MMREIARGGSFEGGKCNKFLLVWLRQHRVRLGQFKEHMSPVCICTEDNAHSWRMHGALLR